MQVEAAAQLRVLLRKVLERRLGAMVAHAFDVWVRWSLISHGLAGRMVTVSAVLERRRRTRYFQVWLGLACLGTHCKVAKFFATDSRISPSGLAAPGRVVSNRQLC